MQGRKMCKKSEILFDALGSTYSCIPPTHLANISDATKGRHEDPPAEKVEMMTNWKTIIKPPSATS